MRKGTLLGVIAVLAVAGGAWWYVSSRPSEQATSHATDADIPQSAYPERVLWGDTHLHSDNSPDAFGWGNRLGADQAFRFARGEKVTSTMGVEAQLDRPLDFLLISDHSDGLGFTKRIANAPRFMLPNDTLKRWHDMFNGSREESMEAMNEMIDMAGEINDDFADPEELAEQQESIWHDYVKLVDDHNVPGEFSAMLGFEYTTMPNGNNLHRVVMFRDGGERVNQVVPLPFSLAPKPHQLWEYMENYETNTGGRVLAIPHNSNVSNGLMFEMTGPGGEPMTAEEAALRARLEPVVEVTQIKGDSETHSFLSPNDEFAGFGVAGWDDANLNAELGTTPDMYAGSYVREALKRGLSIEQRTGVNPYQFGLIGSTDSHTSLATGDEDYFFGKHTGNEPMPEGEDRVTKKMNLGSRGNRFNYHYLAGGYAGVWATANTRSAIFDAFVRREVYSTSGPRMTVRLFAGWDFANDIFDSDWVRAGYASGVPMGGELPAPAGDGAAPRFVVSATKDPEGANLDRVQVIKGWVDSSGSLQEKVFDIVWSDPDERGASSPAPVGNTVDLATGEVENSIGAVELRTVWSDPEFDPSQRAFYYVRVLEIPTPRWVLFDKLRYNLTLPDEVELVAQERALTSPIWYMPAS